jgi:hypothetical protein
MNLTHPMYAARVKQNALGRGGLPGIDVRHDADVPEVIQGVEPGHVDSILTGF